MANVLYSYILKYALFPKKQFFNKVLIALETTYIKRNRDL